MRFGLQGAHPPIQTQPVLQHQHHTTTHHPHQKRPRDSALVDASMPTGPIPKFPRSLQQIGTEMSRTAEHQAVPNVSTRPENPAAAPDSMRQVPRSQPGHSNPDLLIQNAATLMNMTFDAMAVLGPNGAVISCNPPYHHLCAQIGDENEQEGMDQLQRHFLQLIPTLWGDTPAHYSCHDIQGGTRTMSVKIAIKVMPPGQGPGSYMCVLSGQQNVAAGLIVSEPRLSDPLITVVAPTASNRSKRAQPDHDPVLDSQRLWQKYGEKVVTKRKNPKDRVRRAYFKCYDKECLARLTVDNDPETGKRLVINSLGVHNHVVEIHEQSPEAAGPRQKPAPEAAAAPQAAANTSDDISDAQ